MFNQVSNFLHKDIRLNVLTLTSVGYFLPKLGFYHRRKLVTLKRSGIYSFKRDTLTTIYFIST